MKIKVVGTIDKYNIRFVIKRFKQQEYIDYFDIYFSMPRITFIWMLISTTSINKLEIY
jgi:hypothetical protein